MVVAVRLRPLINPQANIVVRADRARSVVRISEGTTAELLDPRSGASRGRFTFDKCFDSFSSSDSSGQAIDSQEDVFNALAPPLLASAMDGYNVTVFAYGQTGSGKSHTMLGTRESPGFIPLFVEALFAACAATSARSSQQPGSGSSNPVQCTLEASYLEIYMEQIRDLLNPGGRSSKSSKGALRVREHPRTGPYVEDLAKVACKSAAEVQILLDHGGTVRTIAATQLNAESSRSHAIFTLRLTQRQQLLDGTEIDLSELADGDDGSGTRVSEKVSKIHLVDLAGSERLKRSGAGGQRLQETGAINKSLSTLGGVISALAAGKRTHVPYRESALTYLLKDGLGGNARTAMLATISPEGADFNETLSTLRYADSAKQIVGAPFTLL